MSGTATLCSLLAFLLLVPAAASARIYKWTDEKGTTVFSNIAPGAEKKAKDVEVVMEDEAVSTLTAQQIAYAAALRRERQLEERIYNLERQAQQPPPPSYPPQYQPPPPPDYYGGSPYYPGYYPGYFPPYVVLSTGFHRPVHRRFASPRFAPGRFASLQHGGAVSRARR